MDLTHLGSEGERAPDPLTVRRRRDMVVRLVTPAVDHPLDRRDRLRAVVHRLAVSALLGVVHPLVRVATEVSAAEEEAADAGKGTGIHRDF